MRLITGATSGIGLAMAKFYAKDMILVGSRNRPHKWPFPENLYCQADLSLVSAQTQITDFLKEKKIKKLDMVIHNAGYSWYGDFEKHDSPKISNMLRVNLITPIKLTQDLLPFLSSGATIVFVCSTGAILPCPYMSVYAATKAGLRNFAESLRLEFNGAYKVICVHPTGTRTNFHKRAGMPRRLRKKSSLMDPDKAVIAINRAIMRNESDVVIGARATAITFAYKVWPWLMNKLIFRSQKP